jgi:hypothetical protein
MRSVMFWVCVVGCGIDLVLMLATKTTLPDQSKVFGMSAVAFAVGVLANYKVLK